MAMQYPLLFHYSEDEYCLGISHRDPSLNATSQKRKKLTMRKYYAFRLQQRDNEGQTLLRGGKLFHQFIINAYSCIEQERLN